jgi:hypothetical protein
VRRQGLLALSPPDARVLPELRPRDRLCTYAAHRHHIKRGFVLHLVLDLTVIAGLFQEGRTGTAGLWVHLIATQALATQGSTFINHPLAHTRTWAVILPERSAVLRFLHFGAAAMGLEGLMRARVC